MATERRIAFRETALFDAKIYAALVADKVDSYRHDPTYGVIETNDSKAGDYPHLRKALRAGSFSYSVYEQLTGADHAHWKYSLIGQAEHSNMNAPAPIQFVRDAPR